MCFSSPYWSTVHIYDGSLRSTGGSLLSTGPLSIFMVVFNTGGSLLSNGPLSIFMVVLFSVLVVLLLVLALCPYLWWFSYQYWPDVHMYGGSLLSTCGSLLSTGPLSMFKLVLFAVLVVSFQY